MAITSQLSHATAGQGAAIRDWSAAGLPKPSLLKPILATIEQTLILRKMGALDTFDRESLARLIATILGQP